MYEHRQLPLLSRAKFLKRLGRHGLVALAVLVFGLGIGVSGYHWVAHLSWIDSLLNASMILGGMGPVDPLPNNPQRFSRPVTLCFRDWRLSASFQCCSRRLCTACCIAFTRRSANHEFPKAFPQQRSWTSVRWIDLAVTCSA